MGPETLSDFDSRPHCPDINQRLFRSKCVCVCCYPRSLQFVEQTCCILALSCRLHPSPFALRPALLRYYKWLWNIYKHHKFNLCRHCARRRVYCAHNKRSSPAAPLPYPLPSPVLCPTPSCESQLSRYWSNLLFLYVSCVCACCACLCVCDCVFLWHAFYTLHIKYSAKIAVAIIFIYYIIFLRRAMWICVVSDKYVSLFRFFCSFRFSFVNGGCSLSWASTKLSFKLRNLRTAASHRASHLPFAIAFVTVLNGSGMTGEILGFYLWLFVVYYRFFREVKKYCLNKIGFNNIFPKILFCIRKIIFYYFIY